MSKPTILVIVLMLGYGAALTLVLDTHVGPGLVRAAYRGESWEPLNRILEFRSQYPLVHYMAKWHLLSRSLSVALIGAAVATLAALLTWRRPPQVILVAILAPALALAAVLLKEKIDRDYFLHLEMWKLTLAGGDPWASDSVVNAYGPIFNLLAIPVALDPFAPKILYALVWSGVIASLATRNCWIALAVMPLGIYEAIAGGRFDILVAICLLAALRDYLAGRDVTAGVWLGVGFLFKFLPLAVLPFLVLDGRRLRWKVALSALTISVAGFALAIWIWGRSAPLRPLLFNSQRPSGSCSLFAFARYVMGFNLDHWSGPIIAVSLGALMVWSVARRPPPVRTALAALGLILAFHKFGSMAYTVMLSVPLAWYVTEGADRMLQQATILYTGWMSACFVVVLTGRHLGVGNTIMFAAGLPNCLIALALVSALLCRGPTDHWGVSSNEG